jgi:hypothetical protein
LSVASDE